jgi:lipoyl(octanoyl) transferase
MQLYVLDLGLTPYDVAWALQKRAAAARISGALDQDLLILVQHPPVVTLGRSTKPGNLLVSPEYLASRGIELRDVERGGDVTIHEPGQLVAYPIIDLKRHKQDLHWYLRQIEEAVIVALTSFGLECGRVEGRTGVWRERETGTQVKLASIGVHAKDWVTSHGVALNVCNDLATFNHVVPCGLGDVQMSTVIRECAEVLAPAPEFSAVQGALVHAFARLFSLQGEPVPEAVAASLGEPLA